MDLLFFPEPKHEKLSPLQPRHLCINPLCAFLLCFFGHPSILDVDVSTPIACFFSNTDPVHLQDSLVLAVLGVGRANLAKNPPMLPFPMPHNLLKPTLHPIIMGNFSPPKIIYGRKMFKKTTTWKCQMRLKGIWNRLFEEINHSTHSNEFMRNKLFLYKHIRRKHLYLHMQPYEWKGKGKTWENILLCLWLWVKMIGID